MTNVVILENDEVRDRKTCITLDQRVAGANRELAQWLMDHPRYSAIQVAEWLGCGETRIKLLRQWAKKGFPGDSYRAMSNRPSERHHGDDAPLKSQGNSFHADDYEPEDGPSVPVETVEVAAPEEIKTNIFDTIERQKAVARS
jgi:hypothetical protein